MSEAWAVRWAAKRRKGGRSDDPAHMRYVDKDFQLIESEDFTVILVRPAQTKYLGHKADSGSPSFQMKNSSPRFAKRMCQLGSAD